LTFSISDEAGKYQLSVSGYSGDAGDAMAAARSRFFNANGMKFSTPDSDNDIRSGGSCAAVHQCGWWFGFCTTNCLTARTIWTARKPTYDVQFSRMLVRIN